MIGFGDPVAKFYKNYFNFYGRASRAEYWWPVLMQLIVYIGLIVAFFALAGGGGEEDVSAISIAILFAGVLFLLFNLIPSYAIAARRFHDLDQTGWLVLVFAIANMIIGVAGIAQMIWFAVPGTVGPNKYGQDPYGSQGEIFE